MAEEVQNEYNLKDILGRMKFDVTQDLIIGQIPSLKFIALNRISITLWRDQLCRIKMCVFTNQDKECRMEICKKKILERISKLLPYIPIQCKVPLEERINFFMKKLTEFFIDQKHFKYFTSLELFNNYWDNICFTQQGTINYVKTAIQLIDNTSLNITDKYIMACDNCLEAKIRTLLELLPKDFIESRDDDFNHLPIFWTFFIKGELENFSSYTNHSDIWDYILRQAINSNNEVAVKYVWENFASEEMKELLNCYETENSRSCNFNMNISHYFLQQMNEIHVLNLDTYSIIFLLEKLNTISKWCDVPPIAKYIHDLIKKYDYHIIIDIILYCWHEKMITLSQYISIWDEVSLHFKLDIEEHFIRICCRIFSKCLMQQYDILSIKLFINISSPGNKMKILDHNAVNYCVQFISIGGPDLLDSFLNHVLEKEENISEFKKKLFDEGSLELCVGVAANCKYEWINMFLAYYFTQDEINEFKKVLPLINNADSIRCISERVKFHDFDFLTMLKKFLNWCFDGNEKELERFEVLVFDVDEVLYSDKKQIFFKILYEIVDGGNKWDLVEKFMKWIFFASKNRIRTPKEKLTRIWKILNLTSQTTDYRLSMGFIVHFELLEKFISWCFQQNEVEELKEELINHNNYLLELVIELMHLSNYQKLNRLLYWCYSSDEVKINEFKTHFFIDSHGCSFLYLLIKYRFIQNVEPLLKWFNPTQESANLFKNSFITFVMKEKKIMSKLFKIYKKTNDQFEEFWTPLEKGVEKCLQILEKVVLERIC